MVGDDVGFRLLDRLLLGLIGCRFLSVFSALVLNFALVVVGAPGTSVAGASWIVGSVGWYMKTTTISTIRMTPQMIQ